MEHRDKKEHDDKKEEQTVGTARDRTEGHEGDVLGLGDTDPNVEIPRATTDRGGNPAGIEVRTGRTGTGEVERGKGVTGMDMGASGSGTEIDRETDIKRKP